MSDTEIWSFTATGPVFGEVRGATVMVNVHPREVCQADGSRPCVLHNPSDHHMRDWPTLWRADRGLMERLCPDHGTGHPDPDHMWFVRHSRGPEAAYWESIHGCCGCCHTDRIGDDDVP